ncbi:L-Ala-D/L-amino acid epimerase isoform X2 [Amborella trichopoda]|uniref:L-Ala-D/L-amino acid epimerase isoform X2 n=1 Tax=Amborella trichopoda TaxID=13333 RepID=UPI0009BF2587|nr:L-Ala-D/L-amino acid epimerase isoform X2 [Amborella trichopoda]|eukprot:XP_020530059.1 L-Ala-D/L-amino acid epimerase isoform X2 [Amborella trichopoda]
MSLVGFLHPLTTPSFLSSGSSLLRPKRPFLSQAPCLKFSCRGSMTATVGSFGFQSLTETFTVDVSRAEGRPLNVPLVAPFTIASSRLDVVKNVAIRVELSNGSVGWGESPILPFVTAEDQASALEKAMDVCSFIKRSKPKALKLLLEEIVEIVPGHAFASVRAGVEMALIDAVANSIRVPLWRLFGGVSKSITTDITIPILPPLEAAKLAEKYFHQDANEGYTAAEAIEVLKVLHEMGLSPILFEQPVHRDNWDGLREVSQVARDIYGVSVAADESCRGLFDVQRIIHGKLADVINIKLAKVGVLGALEIIEIARKAGLDLMIGGMVETRLAMGFAGHLAAGLGCFKFIDLDTPLLLSEDPVIGGYEVSGAVYVFNNARGQGGFLNWNCNE